jgi:hypothetical protein
MAMRQHWMGLAPWSLQRLAAPVSLLAVHKPRLGGGACVGSTGQTGDVNGPGGTWSVEPASAGSHRPTMQKGAGQTDGRKESQTSISRRRAASIAHASAARVPLDKAVGPSAVSSTWHRRRRS